MLPLLYVTSTPTAPILVDRITALVRQDLQAMENIVKVGENTSAVPSEMAVSLRRVTSFKMAANNEIAAIRRICVCFWYRDACFLHFFKGAAQINATFESNYLTKSDV